MFELISNPFIYDFTEWKRKRAGRFDTREIREIRHVWSGAANI